MNLQFQRSQEFNRMIQEQHQMGGGPTAPAAPVTPAAPPTPPTPPTAPPTTNSQTTAQTAIDQGRVVAAQGTQSTILSSNSNDINKGVVKNSLLGG